MAEPAKAPAPEAGGGPSDDVVTRGVGKLKAMLSTNEGRALVDKVSLGHQQRARAAGPPREQTLREPGSRQVGG